MAAGAAGEVVVPAMGDPDEVFNMRATMGSMMDSIKLLQNQMAELMEDPERFYSRSPDANSDDKGPAIRESMYGLTLQSERTRIHEMNEVINTSTIRINELEGLLAFYSGELTTDRDNMAKLNDALRDLRNDTASSRATITGARDKPIVTGIRMFDKLKTYKGTVSEWKEWHFKLVAWLSQSSPSHETLIVKLDYCKSEPTEPVDGVTMMAGTSELTTEEEWCSEQLYQLLVQKCEGPALDIIRNQNTKGKARGFVAWYRTLREAEGQVPQKRSEITEKVFQPDRKAVAAKDVVSTLEAYEGDIRECQILTGNRMDNAMVVVNQKK